MKIVNIRPAVKTDIPQLLDLMYQYIVDYYKCPRPSERSLKNLINHLLENPYEVSSLFPKKNHIT
ncbi:MULTISPECIES: hypothetical protein [unclassified Bacillus (in: firmicutes)]|uniref:hypothetical protein n=1 Tax=unclassified Bacillus (in: firmicutes) TaxID=185979 RepID=UPI002034CBB2|nr:MULTISPECIES: hypothetical protein [unclassified Bacillus (in: firmicutes)]